jgi:hypothetical protein
MHRYFDAINFTPIKYTSKEQRTALLIAQVPSKDDRLTGSPKRWSKKLL